MKLSTLPNAAKLAAIPVIVAFIAIPVLVFAHNNKQEEVKAVDMTASQTKDKVDQKQDVITPVETTQKVEQPVAVEAQTEEQPTEPAAPVNPYPEGFNIWHAFNRRTALGLVTPEGAPSDQTYWQRNKDLITKTPTQHAIIFGSRTTVLGIVESVNADGSLTVSCTNCAQWNVLTEKQIEASAVVNYSFLQ